MHARQMHASVEKMYSFPQALKRYVSFWKIHASVEKSYDFMPNMCIEGKIKVGKYILIYL